MHLAVFREFLSPTTTVIAMRSACRLLLVALAAATWQIGAFAPTPSSADSPRPLSNPAAPGAGVVQKNMLPPLCPIWASYDPTSQACVSAAACPVGTTPALDAQFGCCPAGSEVENTGVVTCFPSGPNGTSVAPAAPVCPAGATVFQATSGLYGCAAPPPAYVGTAAICPIGFSGYDRGLRGCIELPTGCPAGTSVLDTGAPTLSNYCCPAGSTSVDGACLVPDPGGGNASVPPVQASICPAGTTSGTISGTNSSGTQESVQVCSQTPTCPAQFVFSADAGVCVPQCAPRFVFSVNVGQCVLIRIPVIRNNIASPSPSPPAPPPGAAQLPVAPSPGCAAGYMLGADGICRRVSQPVGRPARPAPPIAPVGTPFAPVGTPTTAAPTTPAGAPRPCPLGVAPGSNGCTQAPGAATSPCPPGESQVPGAKPGTCKSCPSGTYPNADGACLKTTTTTKSMTPTTTLKTTSSTTKLQTPTLTPTLTRKPSAPAKVKITTPTLKLKLPAKRPVTKTTS